MYLIIIHNAVSVIVLGVKLAEIAISSLMSFVIIHVFRYKSALSL